MQMKKIIFLSYILKNTWGIITGLFLNVHSVYDDWNFALQTQMYNAISLRLCGFFFFLSCTTVIITIITWYQGFLKRKQVTVKIIMTVTLQLFVLLHIGVFGFLETGSHLCSSVWPQIHSHLPSSASQNTRLTLCLPNTLACDINN